MRGNGLIIGAGILGSAIAAELSRRGVGDLHVVDADLEGPLSSTERNAGGVRHLWQQPINVALARLTIDLIRTVPERVGFQNTGYLWLYKEDRAEEARAMLKRTKEQGLAYEALTPSEIRARYPFLDRTDDLSLGLFGHRDGLINSNSFKQYFRDLARGRGVTFHDRTWVTALAENPGGVTASLAPVAGAEGAESLLRQPLPGPNATKEGQFTFAVLAGGAWTQPLLRALVEDPLVRPIRRQIAVFKAEDLDLSPYGMVVDTSGVYFHPEGGNCLGGFVLKDEPEGFRFHYDPNFFESHIWPALYERSSQFERLKWLAGWSGLYSYTPDTTGLLGRLPGYGSLYEAHSFTGRGVMQSHGAAVALAELIVDGAYRTIDAACLSRERFRATPRDKWLHEGLHI